MAHHDGVYIRVRATAYIYNLVFQIENIQVIHGYYILTPFFGRETFKYLQEISFSDLTVLHSTTKGEILQLSPSIAG